MDTKKPKWKIIELKAWELAGEAWENYIDKKENPYYYIWNYCQKSKEYSKYELEILKKWACDNIEIIKQSEEEESDA